LFSFTITEFSNRKYSPTNMNLEYPKGYYTKGIQ